MEFNETKAINIGKEWMRKSLDPTHDYTHANHVASNALNIYPEFLTVDENLVNLASWWHDSYKATQKGDSLFSIFFEGIMAAKIFEKEVGNLIEPKRRNRVYKAILFHNNPLIFIFFRKFVDPLALILYESDGLELYNEERKEISRSKNRGYMYRLFLQSIEFVLGKIIKIVATSKYTKNIVFKESI
ncbi:MAG TPA: hypothetical protein VHA74_01490 [Candidatus Dojkabacteria bacterium]|nr:hypothetical protein [Candidatus Dojkabacteria bacterium]